MITIISLCLADIVLFNISFLLSFFIKFGANTPEQYMLPYKESYAILSAIFVLTMTLCRVYKMRFKSLWELFERITTGLCLSTVFNICVVYVFRVKWFHFTVSNFLINCILSIIFIFIFNASVLKFFGRIKKTVVVIGPNNFEDVFQNKASVSIQVIDNIVDIVNYKDIDEVVITKKFNDYDSLNLLIYLLIKLKVNVVFSPMLYSELLSKNEDDENTVNFITTFMGRRSDLEEFLIRLFDATFCLIVLSITSPLLLAISIAIRVTSKGPVLYKQIRITKDGKKFTVYKFRTMILNAEENTGPILATKNDSRVTKIGRVLRETRLDEVPQLINVLKGDMCLVGPRPERPFFVKNHKSLSGIRLAVKPGITGLAQIRSLYDLHPKHKIKYDYLYIQKRSFLFNLFILIKTIPVVLFRKGW